MIKELNWITKHSNVKKGIDVSITLSKEDSQKQQTSFRFRNHTSEKITDTGYIKLAVMNNKLFFAKAEPTEGFKLSDASKFGDARGVAIRGFSDLKNGDYDLLFDKEYGLFYVDLSKNLSAGK